MPLSDQIAAAKDQLNRTLGLFPRVDGKASVILAVDTSMLALLTTRASPYVSLRWEWIPIGLAVFMLAMSLWHVHKEAFPTLAGGERSLLYFREIAKLDEASYLSRWDAMADADYINDLLKQVWRNSEILTEKFDHIRLALNYMLAAIIPWLVSIVLVLWRPLASAP